MFEKLENLLVKNFQWIEKDTIKNSSKIREDLGLDSISLVNLQILVEDEFQIKFNPVEDDITRIFNTIDSLLSFIKEKNDE